MKKILVLTAALVMFAGCNINENKEARIRRLEKQNEQTTAKFEQLEDRIQLLESKAGVSKEQSQANSN